SQREGLHHPGQTEVMVGVVVREEDLTQLGQTDVRSQQLALRSFGAVDQQLVSTATDQHRGRGPLRGRARACRPAEDEVDVDGAWMLPSPTLFLASPTRE